MHEQTFVTVAMKLSVHLAIKKRSGLFFEAPADSGGKRREVHPTVSVERLTKKDLARDTLGVFEGRLARFTARIGEQHRLYGVRSGEGIICYLWATVGGEVPLALGAVYKVPDDMVYVWDCKTLPDRRNQGIYGAALQGLRLHEDLRGKKFLIAAEKKNSAAIKAITKAGYVKAGASYSVVKLGPIRIRYGKNIALRITLGGLSL